MHTVQRWNHPNYHMRKNARPLEALIDSYELTVSNDPDYATRPSMIWPSVALSWDRCHIATSMRAKEALGRKSAFPSSPTVEISGAQSARYREAYAMGYGIRSLGRMTKNINRHIAGRSFYKNNNIRPLPPTCHTFQQAFCSELLSRTIFVDGRSRW